MSGAIDISITFQPSYFKKIGTDYHRYIDRAMVLGLTEATGIVKRNMPFDTGNMRDRTVPDFNAKAIRCSANYVWHVNDGTYDKGNPKGIKPQKFVQKSAGDIRRQSPFRKHFKNILQSEGIL